jgi:hypothetical protein
MKHKKVLAENKIINIESKVIIKWYIYKVRKRFLLNPIPYEICKEEKIEILKLIKFCKK